jgi:hypothetical protein
MDVWMEKCPGHRETINLERAKVHRWNWRAATARLTNDPILSSVGTGRRQGHGYSQTLNIVIVLIDLQSDEVV